MLHKRQKKKIQNSVDIAVQRADPGGINLAAQESLCRSCKNTICGLLRRPPRRSNNCSNCSRCSFMLLLASKWSYCIHKKERNVVHKILEGLSPPTMVATGTVAHPQLGNRGLMGGGDSRNGGSNLPLGPSIADAVGHRQHGIWSINAEGWRSPRSRRPSNLKDFCHGDF